MNVEYIIAILIGIVLGTYAYIFKRQDDRLSGLESKPECNQLACTSRFERIERKQSDFEPVLNRIESALSRLEAVLEFLKKDYDNRQR